MPKSKIKSKDNEANMGNRNGGSPGTNRQYDQNQGNRGKQLNPNQDPARPQASTRHADAPKK
jgi:hypothetical protein